MPEQSNNGFVLKVEKMPRACPVELHVCGYLLTGTQLQNGSEATDFNAR